jgi:hypothetical protein
MSKLGIFVPYLKKLVKCFFDSARGRGKTTFWFGGRILFKGTGTEVRGSGGGTQDHLKEVDKNISAMP